MTPELCWPLPWHWSKYHFCLDIVFFMVTGLGVGVEDHWP